MPHYYTYGLHLHSDLPLPELEAVRPGACDVRIVRAAGTPPSDAHAGPEEEWLAWDEIGRIRVVAGTRVTVYLRDGVDAELARLPILGPVLGVVLRQRGRVVLHASAVAVDDSVAAFVGHKGYGKSTTAGALHAQGHPLITDDLLPIALEDDARVWPGFPRLSMWPEAVAALGQDPSAFRALHERVSKKAVWAADGFAAQRPFALGGIYVLGRGARLACEPLSPREAFIELLRHSYCSRHLDEMAPEALSPVFRQYTRLAEAVPVRRLERPNDLNALPDIARMVEDDFRAASPSQAEEPVAAGADT